MNQLAASKIPNEVPSLLVPVSGRPMLVPNVAVAEIVPFSVPMPEAGRPSWFLGNIMWRGVRIPVVNIVRMRGDEEESTSDAHIAVFNGISGKQPFYGVVTQGIPRLVRVRPQDLEQAEGAYTPIDEAFVAVGGELAVIPNLEQIETLIAGE